MVIENKLTDEILSNKKPGIPVIVSISGAADLGKSYLSQKIVESIHMQNLTADHLPMDSYLVDRTVRNKIGLSGYNIEAYHKELALKNVIALKAGQSIELKPYNHKEGKKSKNTIRLNSTDILIFDGLHSMHPFFLPYIDLAIFLYTDDKYLKSIRHEADITKRNYTPQFSKKISDSEFNAYKANIEPYKKNADYLLLLESKWNYTFIKASPDTLHKK